MKHKEETQVVIIGAGVSGLTLATFLKKSGINCVLLERRDRAYIEQRQRAGVVDARAVRMFEEWGLAEELLMGPVAQTIDYRIDGASHVFELSEHGGSPGRFCTQQMLVNNLLKQYIDVLGGEVRWNVNDIAIINKKDARPGVCFDEQVIYGEQIIGCDGDKGISRASIPAGVITTYSHEFGYAWLAALVEAPLIGHPIMAVSEHGFAAQLPRGPLRSRYYLQCSLSDTAADWPDERLWDEIRKRIGDEKIEGVQVHDKQFVPLRSVVHAPMQYNNLYLAGDAAHLFPPASAKGMNMALYDIDILAKAIVNADKVALASYSETVLPHIWNYQDFAVWMTDTMHDAGDPNQHGTFKQMIARARLGNLFASETAALLHSEYQRGMN